MTTQQKFDRLSQLYGEIADLGFAAATLHWDQQTQMPPRGSEARSLQLSTLSTVIHEKMIAKELGALVEELKSADGLDEFQKAFVRELAFQSDRSAKLPESLVRELSLETARAFDVWVRAKREKDFKIFQPALTRIVELVRQSAECYGYEGTPWNALVPDYEKGLSAERLEKLLTPLRDATVKLLEKILSKPKVDTAFLKQQWDIPAQREFGLRVVRDLGYDMAAGRQDISAHPFSTTLGLGDCRITTRYTEDSLLDALLATIHEAGHSMYEQGIDAKLARTPLFDGAGLGVHESQSRFWEVRIGHTRPFWRHYLPILKQYFPGRLDGVDVERFYKAANRVEPGFLRVESDEVSYNLHVILRFELELQLFNKELEVADLPEAWNGRFEDYFGFAVPDDSKGVLQDVHWSGGSFGYFPTYSLGNIYNAMLTEKMEGDMPGMWDDVASGRFEGILAWLRKEIHRHGKTYLPSDLMKKAAGKEASPDALIRHLDEKYTEIYGL